MPEFSDTVKDTFALLFNAGIATSLSHPCYVPKDGLYYEANHWTANILGRKIKLVQIMTGGSNYELSIDANTWAMKCRAEPPRNHMVSNDEYHWAVMGPFWHAHSQEGLYLYDFEMSDPLDKMLADLAVFKLAL